MPLSRFNVLKREAYKYGRCEKARAVECLEILSESARMISVKLPGFGVSFPAEEGRERGGRICLKRIHIAVRGLEVLNNNTYPLRGQFELTCRYKCTKITRGPREEDPGSRQRFLSPGIHLLISM